jgi:hypothetical protein
MSSRPTSLALDVCRSDGFVHDALEDRPERVEDLTDRRWSSRGSGARRIPLGGFGVVRGEDRDEEPRSGRVGHAPEGGDDLRATGVRAKHVPLTGAQVQEVDVGAMASEMVDTAFAVVGLSHASVAMVLGVSKSRVTAKLDPKRSDAPWTWPDHLRLILAGGKAKQAALLVVDRVQELFEQDPQPLPPPSARTFLELQLEEAELEVRTARLKLRSEGRRGLLAYERAKLRRNERERIHDRVMAKGAA